MHQTIVEVEALEVSRTQELRLSVSHDGGQTYRELRHQEYNFSPPGTTFEHEDWVVLAEVRDAPATVDEAGQRGQVLPGHPHFIGLKEC